MTGPGTTTEQQIRSDLLTRYGPLLSGDSLRQALGYPTIAAMRQSIVRQTVPVPTFTIPGRRGRFALTWVVARWLAARDKDPTRPERSRAPRSRGPPES